MTPAEAIKKGLDAGAASVNISLNNGTIELHHGTLGELTMKIENVKDGTWNAMFKLLESSGDVTHRTTSRWA